MRLNSHPAGRHFLQIPGPTNVPDRVLRAMDYPTIDHRGPEFNALAKKVLRSVRQIFQTKQPVIVYPASGTGAWEAALVNTLSPGDLVLMWETGHFASLWKKMADKLGVKSEFMGGDWRKPADPAAIEAPEGGYRPRHQGGLHRPQRDLDGRGERHFGGTAGHRCG